MDLVFATHNPNKLKEIKALLPDEINLLSLDDIGCNEEIPETRDTIEGNAIQKAEFVKKKFGYNCFADDTGLEVAALEGAPGVYSARYAGDQKDSQANMRKLLQELEEKEERQAQFKTVIALQLAGTKKLFTGICRGSITRDMRGNQGFGYDPVFLPEGETQTFAEMSLQKKSKLSHRGRAVRELIAYLSK